jgi:pyruvate formate lyase activating enzyme
MPSDRERNEKWPVDAEVAASGSQPTGHGGVGRREFLTQMGSLAAATPLGLVLLSGAAAWAVHRFRAPETVAKLFPTENPHVRTAQFWRPVCAGVQCTLCPFECFLPDGARGRCRVRMNHGGRLVTLVFGHPVSVAIDPIEKKPVFHLIPGSLIYSLATVGCNLTCKFCQNWEISQTWPEQAAETVQYPKGLLLDQARGGQVRIDVGKTRVLSPEEIVQAALRTGCKSIAYTYSEPMVFYEYVLETAKLGKEHGLKNVLVSCGYINPEPLR